MINDIEHVLLTKEDINQICEKLGKQISEDYQNSRGLILVGLLKGCLPFMCDLAKKINLPVILEYMVVKSYHGSKSSGNVAVKYDLTIDIAEKDVIIIEDIVDTGLTLTTIKKLLLSRKANSVKVATLLDKPEGRKVPFIADYVGCEIPNKFVVGYGLDYNEKYRNLEFVGILKPSVYQKEEIYESGSK